MNDSKSQAVSISPAEELITFERQCRRKKRLAWLYGLPSWILLVVGPALSRLWPNAGWPTLLIGVAVGGLAVAAAYLAISRGRSAAWGLLGPAAFFLLPLLPDKAARRLDDLDFRITGTSGTRSLKERNGVIEALVIGLVIFPLAKQYLPQDRPLPPPATRQLLSSRPTSSAASIFENKHFRLPLPPGWLNITTAQAEAAGDVVALARIPEGIGMKLYPPILKAGLKGATLVEYATIHQGIRKSDYKEILSNSAIIPETLRGRPAYRYELHSRNDKLDMRYVIWVWESANHFWAAETYALSDGLERNRAELRTVVEQVQAKYE